MPFQDKTNHTELKFSNPKRKNSLKNIEIIIHIYLNITYWISQ